MEQGKRIPLYQQIYRDMREKIETGVWPVGMKLLSVREQAETLGVSKFTVERVYTHLASEGYIRRHNRARYEVLPTLAFARRRQRSVRNEEKSSPWRYDLATGAMDKEGFRFRDWRRYFYRVWNREDRLLDYGDERGEYELREALARYGADARDTFAYPEDIVIGSSTQQLLRILAGLLRNEHSEILFAEDAFPLGAATFADEGYGVSILAAGAVNARSLQLESSRLLYVLPSHTYRTATVMPAQVRAELIAWSQAKNAWLIEDDFDSELAYYGSPLPSLQGMAGGERVVYLGSLSKVLPPSFRIAYMILPPELSARFERSRDLYRQTASVAEQLALAEYIRRGELHKQIRRLRTLYREKGEALQVVLREVFGEHIRIEPPLAGIYCRVYLPSRETTAQFIQRAAQVGVRVRSIPGHRKPDEIGLLLVFGHLPVKDFHAAATTLYEVWQAGKGG